MSLIGMVSALAPSGSVEHEWPSLHATRVCNGAGGRKRHAPAKAKRSIDKESKEAEATDLVACFSDSESMRSWMSTSAASAVDSEVASCPDHDLQLRPSIVRDSCAAQQSLAGAAIPALPTQMLACSNAVHGSCVHIGRFACIEDPVNSSEALAKQRSREATLARAKREALPLKVRSPEGASETFRNLDPTLPAKQRLVFEELAGITASALTAMAQLPRGEPVHKRLTPFLLQDPPAVGPPPGLPVLQLAAFV